MKNLTSEDRRTYEEALHIASRGFDNIIFVVGTGTFAVTVSFLTGLKSTLLQWPLVLIASWISFGLAIVLHALSHREAFKHASEALWNDEIYETALDAKYSHVTTLNNIAFYLVVLGMACLVCFAAKNVLAANYLQIHENIRINQSGSR